MRGLGKNSMTRGQHKYIRTDTVTYRPTHPPCPTHSMIKQLISYNGVQPPLPKLSKIGTKLGQVKQMSKCSNAPNGPPHLIMNKIINYTGVQPPLHQISKIAAK